MALKDKLRKNCVIDKKILSNSKNFNKDILFSLDIPLLNLALSGSFKDAGVPPGMIMIAAQPKHFKSNLMLQFMKAFQKENEGQDSLIVFYDSEFGTPPSYLESAGIDISEEKFDHRPVTTVEEFRSDVANLLNDTNYGDKVFICVDSIGMLSSKKELNDAIEGNEAADMTRAKALKSTFRIITPELTKKNIAMLVINHTYTSQDRNAEEIISGGRGTQYAGHTIWTISKRKEKDGDQLEGFTFTINSRFSRYVRELSKFPLKATFDGGIEKYTGLFDLALDLGYIVSPKMGWYKLANTNDDEKLFRRAAVENDETFMLALLNDPSFNEVIENAIKLN